MTKHTKQPHIAASAGHASRRSRSLGQCRHCGKLTYSSRKDAKAAMRGLKASPNYTATESPMRTYPCPTGAGWHFGHHPRAVAHGTLSYQDWAARQGHIAKASLIANQREHLA